MVDMINAPRTSPSRTQRRSARIPLRVRVVVHINNDPQIDAETVLISRYGAKVRIGPSHRPLTRGDSVRICKRGAYSWCPAHIVWTDRITNNYYGIELESQDNFWGVYFPDEASGDDSSKLKVRRGFTPLARRNLSPLDRSITPSVES